MAVVKELSIKVVVEEKYLLQAITMMQESDHSSVMLCDELHIYKQQPVIKPRQIIPIKKGGNKLPQEESKVEAPKQDVSESELKGMIETILTASSFKAQKAEYYSEQQFSSILLQIRSLTVDKVSDNILAMLSELFLKRR